MAPDDPVNQNNEFSIEETLPFWVEPAEHAHWPTRIITDGELRYRLAIRQGWSDEPERIEGPLEIEHRYAGLYRPEWLTISFMDQADPASELRHWVEALVAMKGWPMLAMDEELDDPQLVEWQSLGSFPLLAERLQVEQVLLYQGLVELRTPPVEYGRLYFLLAQRERLAWKVGLSLLSACFPGSPEEIIRKNDHVRAGATFGALALL